MLAETITIATSLKVLAGLICAGAFVIVICGIVLLMILIEAPQ
jgi:hypothetical protein